MRSCKFINQIIKALGFFRPKQKDIDFSEFMDGIPQTRKQRLIEECRKQDVSIYIDDSTEHSAGIYAEFRCAASEAELDRRLNVKKTTDYSKRANVIALLALLTSVIALIMPFLINWPA